MKKILCIGLIILSVMLLLPLTTMKNTSEIVEAATTVKNIPKASKAGADKFRLYDTSNDKVKTISAEDYIFGVVAAEMPALYDTEALKAQAVASYTYACYRRAENSDKSYDITTDYTVDQSYITEEKARERWGEKADEYIKKIKGAISEVSGYMITYKNQPILAVYHAISSGTTESSANVWGRELPYLKAVDSPGDKLSPDYISTLELSADTLVSKLSSDIEFSGNASDYFGEIKKTDSGTVKEITVCNKSLTGARIRSLLQLRSSCYDVEFANEKFTFTVYGYGHGVGMSQYGANYMAKQGSNFKEILTCYYSGCKVEKF